MSVACRCGVWCCAVRQQRRVIGCDRYGHRQPRRIWWRNAGRWASHPNRFQSAFRPAVPRGRRRCWDARARGRVPPLRCRARRSPVPRARLHCVGGTDRLRGRAGDQPIGSAPPRSVSRPTAPHVRPRCGGVRDPVRTRLCGRAADRRLWSPARWKPRFEDVRDRDPADVQRVFRRTVRRVRRRCQRVSGASGPAACPGLAGRRGGHRVHPLRGVVLWASSCFGVTFWGPALELRDVSCAIDH